MKVRHAKDVEALIQVIVVVTGVEILRKKMVNIIVIKRWQKIMRENVMRMI